LADPRRVVGRLAGVSAGTFRAKQVCTRYEGGGTGGSDPAAERAGFGAASAAIFVPNMRAALDKPPSIATTLAQAIKSGVVQAAIRQHRTLRAVRPVTMNFDDDELNAALGYELMGPGPARRDRGAERRLFLQIRS